MSLFIFDISQNSSMDKFCLLWLSAILSQLIAKLKLSSERRAKACPYMHAKTLADFYDLVIDFKKVVETFCENILTKWARVSITTCVKSSFIQPQEII